MMYKPCFSAGSDLPIGDWFAPFIQDKTHEVFPVDNEVVVTVYDVEDRSFQYLSWEFAGLGVPDDGVQVAYTFDPDATNPEDWEYETAINVGDVDGNGIDDYQATIVIDPLENDVSTDAIFYYARAIDHFSNVTTFPDDVDEWTTAGDLLSQELRNAQTINRVTEIDEVGGGDDDTNNGNDDPSNVDDDVDSATLTNSGNLAFSKSVFPSVASVGDTVTWTVFVAGTTGADQFNVIAVDHVPPELDIISASAPVGSVRIEGQQVIFEIDRLAAGQNVTITISLW